MRRMSDALRMGQSTLTASDLRHILERWESLANSPEVRASVRTQLCASVAIAELIEGKLQKPFDVIISDLSPGGIGFIHTQPLLVSREFVVSPTNGNRAATIRFHIAYCGEMDDGRYRIGGKFPSA